MTDRPADKDKGEWRGSSREGEGRGGSEQAVSSQYIT